MSRDHRLTSGAPGVIAGCQATCGVNEGGEELKRPLAPPFFSMNSGGQSAAFVRRANTNIARSFAKVCHR